MERQRSRLAGMTDYTGVDLAEIIRHIHEWRANTVDTIDQLRECRIEVTEQASRFAYAPAVTDYIDFFIDLFGRYQADFERLATELPMGVTSSHLETIKQLLSSARLEENRCELFREREIAKTLPDESVRPILDRVYRLSRGTLYDYWDLSNVHKRLRALRGSAGTASSGAGLLDAVELKPNVFGFGVNLNQFIPKVRRWWQERRKKRKA